MKHSVFLILFTIVSSYGYTQTVENPYIKICENEDKDALRSYACTEDRIGEEMKRALLNANSTTDTIGVYYLSYTIDQDANVSYDRVVRMPRSSDKWDKKIIEEAFKKVINSFEWVPPKPPKMHDSTLKYGVGLYYKLEMKNIKN